MTDQEPRSKAAAGWYPHPSMPGTRRYWNGAAWTDHVAPAATPVASTNSGPSTSKIAAGVTIGVLGAVVAVWLVVGIATSNDDLECATDNAERSMDGRPLLDCD